MFEWNAGLAASQYQLLLGSTVGGSDYYLGNVSATRAANVALPISAQPRWVYATLRSLLPTGWEAHSYTYTLNSAPAPEGNSASDCPAQSTSAYVLNDGLPTTHCYLTSDPSYFTKCSVSGGSVTATPSQGGGLALIIEYKAARSAAPGHRTVSCDNGTDLPTEVPNGLDVYDASPHITYVYQYPPESPDGSFYVALYGRNFGPQRGNVSVCAPGADPCSGTQDMSVSFNAPYAFWSDTQINVLITPSPNASGTYDVQLTSLGQNGISFSYAPGQSSPGKSDNRGQVHVTPLTSVSQVAKYSGAVVPILYMSTGDVSGRTLTTSVVPDTASFAVTYNILALGNPGSSCQAALGVPNGGAVGFINSPVSADGSGCSGSGIFSVRARANGRDSSNESTIVVPPQVLIQMLYGEANGQPRGVGDLVSQRAIGVAARNRLTQPIWRVASYQDVITKEQFDGIETTIVNGPDYELAAAAEVYSRTTDVSVLNAGCFFSPTASAWATIQSAFSSQTTVVPTVAGDPRCYNMTAFGRQLIIKRSIGMNANGSGAPAFIFEQQRDSEADPAVIEIP